MSAWRAPHTMPKGQDVICAYRWSERGPVAVTLGRWFDGDQFPGVIEAPNGPYIPCIGWLPKPEYEGFEAFLPINLRTWSQTS